MHACASANPHSGILSSSILLRNIDRIFGISPHLPLWRRNYMCWESLLHASCPSIVALRACLRRMQQIQILSILQVYHICQALSSALCAYAGEACRRWESHVDLRQATRSPSGFLPSACTHSPTLALDCTLPTCGSLHAHILERSYV